MPFTTCASCLCLVLGVQVSADADVWVQVSGADGESCGADPATPCATLAFAVERASPGGTVHVLYSPTPFGCSALGVSVSSSITIAGSSSPNKPVIDCAGGGRAFNFTSAPTSTPEWTLHSLVIQGGFAPVGGGVAALGGKLNISNVDFADCVAWRDGAVMREAGAGLYAENVNSLVVSDSNFLRCAGRFDEARGGAVAVLLGTSKVSAWNWACTQPPSLLTRGSCSPFSPVSCSPFSPVAGHYPGCARCFRQQQFHGQLCFCVRWCDHYPGLR